MAAAAAAAENTALFHKRVVEAQGLSQFWVRMEVRGGDDDDDDGGTEQDVRV